MFGTTYPEFALIAPKAGFDFALQVNVDVITPSNASTYPRMRFPSISVHKPLTPCHCFFMCTAAFINRIASLKRNILSAPFEQCFEALANGSSSSLAPVQIPFRRNETMYVLPQADRIVIVYSVCFDDKTDQAIARVFLQVYMNLSPVTVAGTTSWAYLLLYFLCRNLWIRVAR